jgi:hypothetical protein
MPSRPNPRPKSRYTRAVVVSPCTSHGTLVQSSLATHVDKVHALGTVFAKHDAFRREVGVLRQLVADREDEEFGSGVGMELRMTTMRGVFGHST